MSDTTQIEAKIVLHIKADVKSKDGAKTAPVSAARDAIIEDLQNRLGGMINLPAPMIDEDHAVTYTGVKFDLNIQRK